MAQKKNKIPLAYKLIRIAFGVVQFILPQVAARWSFKLFCSPLRFPYSEKDNALMAEATTSSFETPYGVLPVYSWGEGPTVMLMHGWAGRPSQFRMIIRGIAAAGFRVLAFDAPAHGKSEGKQTNLYEFAECFIALEKKEGPFYTALGHSLGATTVLLAENMGELKFQKRILISVPSKADDIFEKFSSKIGAGPGTEAYIRKRVIDLLEKPFDFFTAHEQAAFSPHIPSLLIHDKEDREADFDNARELQSRLPGAEFVATSEQGHVRILRDGKVVDEIISFLKKDRQKSIKKEEEVQAVPEA